MAEAQEFEMDPATYGELEALDDEAEDIELEMIRHNYKISQDHYARRAKTLAKIPHFWPLVLEQSPLDIEEFIKPTDAAVLMNTVTGLTVDRFELANGDPRSISITWEFNENEHFEDTKLEKKFWWRNAKDGSSMLVSEPVAIKWKEGKDLTNGMLDLARTIYEEDVARGGPTDKETENKKKLKAIMETTGMDGLSFFAWFGFRGRYINDKEHEEATVKEHLLRQQRKEGKVSDKDDEKMDEEDEEEDDDSNEYELEIFPTGDELAFSIADDLWPNAIKYFIQSQEDDVLSDIEFEEMSDAEMEDGDDDKEAPANKKRKA